MWILGLKGLKVLFSHGASHYLILRFSSQDQSQKSDHRIRRLSTLIRMRTLHTLPHTLYISYKPDGENLFINQDPFFHFLIL